MRIFLSLGMRGRDEKDVLADIAEATHYAKSMYAESATEYEVINTYNQEEAPEDASRTYYLGRSIQILGGCDQVWFINDWENYRGCLIEHEVCKTYGIPCYALDLRTVRLRVSEALDAHKKPSAYDLFQVSEKTINDAKNAIKDAGTLVSEYKDLFPDARILLDASENAISLGLEMIDHLIHIIETEN